MYATRSYNVVISIHDTSHSERFPTVSVHTKECAVLCIHDFLPLSACKLYNNTKCSI